MFIASLQIRNVRNLTELELELGPGLNLFQGPNGSGKTALLEAVFLLARGRSFRTTRLSEIARYGETGFQVVAHIRHGQDGDVVTGVSREGKDLSVRYHGEPVPRMSSHARRFPVSIATPDSQDLIHGSPKVRRRWLDWGLFHVEQNYLEKWRAYHRALRQRNCLLKTSTRSKELAAWEQEMASYSTEIQTVRARFIVTVSAHMQALAAKATHYSTSLHLKPGWDMAQSLLEELEAARGQDAAAGFTRSGPHRADVTFAVEERDAATVLSRGQSKLYVVLLAMALSQAITELGGESPVLLLDDPAAELDRDTQAILIRLISDQACQSLMSLPNADSQLLDSKDMAVFHVKRGDIRKMVRSCDS